MMYGWHDHGSGAASWMVMGVVMLLFWALVAVLVIFLVRRWNGTESHPAGGEEIDRAELTLRSRYALGEIDEEEFAHRRDVLRGST